MRAEADQYVVEKIVVEKLSVVAEDMNYDHFVLALAGDERLAEVDYAVIKAVYDKVSISRMRDDADVPAAARAHGLAEQGRPSSSRKASPRFNRRPALRVQEARSAGRPRREVRGCASLRATVPADPAQVLPRIEATPEFKALDDEADRKTAFDKFVKRQRVRSRLSVRD